jgi:hypothetical protein
MAGLASSDITAILKELYPDSKVRELLYEKTPFLGMVPKDRNAYGELVKVPLRYGDPQGASATFASGRTAISPSKYTAFDITTVNDYAFAEVSGEAIDKSKNDKGSFIRALDREIKGAMRQAKRRISHAIFRSGSGSIGRRASLAGEVVTLSDPNDTRFFEVGMTVVADSVDGGGTVNAGSTTVAAVDRSAGTVTLTASASLTGFADNDYLFPLGDYDAKLKGLNAWIPASAPGATPFFGVARNADPTRLGGCRKDLSGKAIEEALIEASELVWREGGSPDVALVHSVDFMNLQKALGSKVIYGARDSYDTKVGYRTIQMEGPSGTIDIVSDPDALPNVMWLLQMDTWTLHSMGETPKYLDNDGNAILRTTTSDAVEVQLVSRLQLSCAAPGWNGRFVIGS